MKFFIFLLIIPSFCFGAITDHYPPLTDAERARFHQSVHETLAEEQRYLRDLEKQLSGVAMRPGLRPRYLSIVTDLQAKQVIVSNFANSEKLRSPVVRKALIDLLRRIPMTQSDMLRFQQIVDIENQRPPPSPGESDYPLFPEN